MNSAISEAIGQVNSFDMAVVQALPTEDISTHTIYLVPKTGETNDVYDEYIYINDAWEMVGNTQIDLSGYALKSELPTKVSDLTDDSGHYIKPATGIPASDLADGVIPDALVQDVQVNGVSVLQDGVANVPVANDTLGLVRVLSTGQDGVRIRTEDGTRDKLVIVGATEIEIKNRNNFKPVLPSHQHESTFYGLAKAAGDTTQSQSNNAVGQYTDEAKAAIQTMLGVPSTSDMAAYTTKADTVLNTTLSLGRLANSEVGENSVALGDNVTASGPYSFATGSETVASSDSAYAEGEGTQATDSAAHAEGTYTQATGYASHAEGDNTIAEGYFSHAEGTETTATGMATHVFGERNFNCNESVETNERGTMVEIVGNGQDDIYSNARALTWTGDEYLAGNLYVNANSTSTSGTRVATVAEIPEVPV